MSQPAPSRADHNQFCINESWTVVRARGKKVGHHITYEKTLPDGRILRTRVSRPPNKETYGPALCNHILHDQLQVDENAFWSCVSDGVLPDRGQPKTRKESLPAELVHLLKTRLILPETEIGKLTRDEAINRMQEYWQQGLPGG